MIKRTVPKIKVLKIRTSSMVQLMQLTIGALETKCKNGITFLVST